MGLGGVAIAVLPSMIYPKQPFSDGLGGGVYYFSFIKLKVSTFLVYKVKKCLLNQYLRETS